MAEENKETQEAKPEAKKEEAPGAAAEAPAAKGDRVFVLGLGGGAAAVIAMAYFLTVAAVDSGAQETTPAHAEEEKKPAELEQAGEHGEKKADEHAPAAEGEHGAEPGKEGGEPKVVEKRAVAELDEFETNPYAAGLKRFFHGKFAVVLEADDAPKFAAKLGSDAEIRSRVMDGLISLIKGKKVEELEGAVNERTLKREIGTMVARLIFPQQEGKVVDVLFVKFLVQ